MKKKLIILLSIVLFSGCASSRVLFQENKAKSIKPPLPSQLDLRAVEWKFFNANSNTWFALDNENYLQLSKNMVDMAEYVQKLRIIIQTYETNNVQFVE
jgi:predicted RND superfamily exporter protein